MPGKNGSIKRLIFLAATACFTLLGCSFGSALAPASESTATPLASDEFTVIRLSPSNGSLQDLLNTEAGKAQELGQSPFVEFDAVWCPHCQALNESLSDARMIDACKGTYIIQLDLDEWKDALPAAGFDVAGIPAIFEIDREGKPTGRTITGAAWGEDIPENMAPPLKEFFDGGADTQ